MPAIRQPIIHPETSKNHIICQLGRPICWAIVVLIEHNLNCVCVCIFHQFVADGIFKAELNEFLTRELAEDGYSGVEVRVTPTRTEIIIMATKTQNVLGEKGRRIRELTAVVQKR